MADDRRADRPGPARPRPTPATLAAVRAEVADAVRRASPRTLSGDPRSSPSDAVVPRPAHTCSSARSACRRHVRRHAARCEPARRRASAGSYQPDERTVHTRPTPDVGGLAMFVGFLVGARRRPAARHASTRCSPATPSRAASSLGGVDHLRRRAASTTSGRSRRRPRSPARCSPGSSSCASASTMYYFRVPFVDGRSSLSDDWMPLITVLWLLGMTQAINLIDGLDGLAAGIVAIAAGAFFLYSQKLERPRPARRRRNIGPLVAIIAVGHVRRLPAAQLQPGADLHGRRRRAAARPADGRVDERRRRPGRPEPASSSARRTSSSPRCSSRC